MTPPTHLQVWDLENPSRPVFEVQAHASIVNQLDGCGGQVRAQAGRVGVCALGGCGRGGQVRA